ncbi:MAG: type II secretion system F family protein [Planctomycetes bacterium]|nr:type II secretion system F family protein [Planctomycetota bacterium]
MPYFRYISKDAAGKIISGKIKANNKEQAGAQLKAKGLTPVSFEKMKGGFFASLLGDPKPHIKSEALGIFTRQLSTMISAGIPLLESLEILTEQADDAGFKLAMQKALEKLRSGSDLSEALSDYPKIFTRIYISMIKAGEASGQLDTVLTRLAEFMESTEKLKREIKAAMTYPVVSLVMILGIASALLIFIVPKFKTIFTQLKVPLPAITKGLLALSDNIRDMWFVWIGIIVAIFVSFSLWKKSNKGEKMWHHILLKLPIFGQLFVKVAISRFSKTFSTLIQSGVPILGALEIVAATSGNRVIEDAVLKARENVRKGETLGEPLGASKVFPPMVTRMISIGEKSGALEQLLEKISEFYDQQVESTVEGLTALIEPVMIGLMGVVVGGMVLAIFMPILKIQEALQKK